MCHCAFDAKITLIINDNKKRHKRASRARQSVKIFNVFNIFLTSDR